MRLAVFFPASLFSAWACSYGLVDCLRRMGHEVIALPVDPAINGQSIPRTDLFDAAIISGPEHIAQRIGLRFRKNGCPTVAWLHETVEREDYGKLDVEAIKQSADIVFCPGIQDEKYGFRYLPFGVDTEIFNPALTTKTICAAFIGLLYPKRQAFLSELKRYGADIKTGNVQVLGLGGIDPRKTAELYAENIRKIKVFVNLPTLSQLAVTKIYEVLACGTHILTPCVSDMRNFEGLPCDPYEENAEKLANRIRLLMGGGSDLFAKHGAKNAQIMHEKHRLELRCEVLVNGLKEIGATAA